LDTVGEANSVIDLMFLQSGSNELNNHSIYPEWQLSSDYAPITVSILIAEEKLSNLSDSNKLEDTTNSLTSSLKNSWRMNSKQVNIMRHSKSW